MATHSSVRAWRIPRTGEPGRLQVHGVAESNIDWATNIHSLSFSHLEGIRSKALWVVCCRKSFCP